MSLPFWLAVPEVRDPLQAEYDSWGLEVAGFAVGKPFSTDPAYTTQNGAIANYVAHMEELRLKKGWPAMVVEPFIALAYDAPGAPGYAGAAAVYTYLLGAETTYLEAHGLSADHLDNWNKHRAWLAAAAEASGASSEALEAAGWFGVVSEGLKKTKEDVSYPLGIPLWGWVGLGAVAYLAISK